MRERLMQGFRFVGPALLVGVILGLIGPFGTFGALPLFIRLLYWIAVVAVNWLLCDLAVRRLHDRLPGDLPFRDLVTPLLGGLLASLPATGLVHTAGVLAGLEVGSMPSLFWKVLLLCATLSVLFYLNAPDPAAEASEVESFDDDPAPAEGGEGAHRLSASTPGHLFLARLEAPLEGKLLCLEMQDHYMVVHTTAGRQLVLCRMVDAERELEGLGRRVHRSWWVAEDAVAGRERQQGRLALALIDGRRVPVGRTYQPAVRNLPLADGTTTDNTAGSRPLD